MKKTYISPSLEISLFETEDVLNISGGNAGGMVVAPPANGGNTEVGGGIELGW